MPINIDLLVAAPILQDYFVNKDNGEPLAAGIVTLYTDDTMMTLKNWYTQEGTRPPYSYVPLPNPMTLSSVGTTQDNSGNDIIPYYYPYDEADNVTPQPYFITVQNANLEIQFTRSNFPFLPSQSTGTTVSTNDNIIVNSNFWRNQGTVPINSTTLTNAITINSVNYIYATVAPSQHDNFIMPDINYFKTASDGTETITFTNFVSTFPDNILDMDITPEFYMNVNCTALGSSTVRYLQIPLSSHIDSLSGYANTTFTLQAMSVNPTATSNLTVGVFQYNGSGVNATPIATKTLVLGPSWNKFSINLPIPSAQGVTTGAGGDDGLYIQIFFPTAAAFNINIALPEFYLSDTAATNSFQTYDQVNAIISSPRTGDVRVSTNSFYPFGWTPMNDGIISLNTTTNLTVSRTNADVWPLFSLLWNLAKPYDSGSNSNPICQLYTNSGAATNYGSSAISDFTTSNRALQLTAMMGRVLLGTVPFTALSNVYSQTIATYTSGYAGAMLITLNAPGTVTGRWFNGMPVIFTTSAGGSLPSNIVRNAVYYVGGINVSGANSFYISPSFFNATQVAPQIAVGGGIIAIVFSGGQSGTQIVSLAQNGSTLGQYAHTPLLAELAAHTHTIPTDAGTGLSTIFNQTTSRAQGAANTGSTGNGVPFNVVQPSTLQNIFIKL